ncbi:MULTISPECIES: dynamin family protein [Bacillaceae]|uniref:Dynamin family protein n=1 Tax=Evansella alkalicola TaxID=745819 RepID=A0ABS6JU34_9BACI|nr:MULTISPECIES: dynamin family protein [Bacillaceae]MBU9722074.1 dynamin family protein [Bacillus alkalicola]
MIHKTIQEQSSTIPLTAEEKFRLKRLEQKHQKNVFEMAFCGHFSAGKSTMLNKLLGAEVLPTSPIPTSANIIELKNGELGLTIKTQKNDKKWDGEIPWNEVRKWGMDGQEIQGLTITADLPFLGENSSILDTPGVDSTDASHEKVTVEQLYTTDVIVYVMDYNHVQSETNLYFLKQLSDENKPIYIVINQIDKHNDDEIPFIDFKSSVETILGKWNIHYIKMFFTSMKKPNHHLNEFGTMENELKGLLYNSHKLLDHAASRLEQGFYQSVALRLREQKQENATDIIEEMKEQGFSLEQLKEKEHLLDRLDEVSNYKENYRKMYHEQLSRLFKNVTLFPYSTTDLTRSWIESLQPGFKVGLLFSKKKTEEERNRRLQLVLEDLKDKVKTQLIFHVTDFLKNLDRTVLDFTSDFDKAIEELAIFDEKVVAEMMLQLVNAEHASREYVYTFTKEITESIVKLIKERSLHMLETYIVGAEKFHHEEKDNVLAKINELGKLEKFEEQLRENEIKFDKLRKEVETRLAEFPANDLYFQHLSDISKGSFPQSKGQSFRNITDSSESLIEPVTDLPIIKEESQEKISIADDWLKDLKRILQNFKGETILSTERERLIDRINRYENKTFIISLFGAFSAGKSSFANALLGDSVLPVSPNPTTATVTTIQRSTEQYKHATAVISFKTKEALDQEIKSVSQHLGQDINLDKLKKWVPDKKSYITGWQKTNVEYLLTIKKSGIDSNDIGSDKIIPLDLLDDFVANEDNACLIEKVHIYYDCDLTEKGIVLVDTPGVNSVHGRHTNVAFKQMQKSDAIFYLTYYNHAFSKSDQYFLQQIGQVNESFEHNKLYFVLNAADLASSTGELNGVKNHVFSQLQSCGIKEPRLFHLSSKEGLLEKKRSGKNSSTFSAFENFFHQHTISELKVLSLGIIKDEFLSYGEKLNDSIHFIEKDLKLQKEKYEQYSANVSNQKELIDGLSFEHVTRDAVLELEQLSLYLQDRMKYVLYDYYSSAINVSVLTGNSKKELHFQLNSAIREWVNQGETFFKHELEATIIRVEEKMKERAVRWLQEASNQIKSNLPYFSFDSEIALSALKYRFPSLLLQVESKNYTGFLKSKKDFFENNKSKELREQLVSDGFTFTKDILKYITHELSNAFTKMAHQLESELKNRLQKACDQELERFNKLFDPEAKDNLYREKEQLSALLEKENS